MSLGDKMCCQLFQLIDRSLRPLTEEDVVLETKEKEKELLIALSHVLTEIQRWIQETDCNSDSVAVQMLASQERSTDEWDKLPEGYNCMTKIISDLVHFLTFENQYVKHLVGNILTATSKFVTISGSYWNAFVHSICFCLNFVLVGIISSSAPSFDGSENSGCYLLSLSNILQPKLKNANFSVVAEILRALRNTLKFLKQERSDLVIVFFDSVDSCLSKVSWDFLGRALTEKICDPLETPSSKGLLHSHAQRMEESKVLFLGNFVQFLCSSAELNDFEEAAGGFLNNHPLFVKIIKLIPNLLEWCLNNQVSHFDRSLSRYFRHKLLILMIRLSFQCQLQCSVLLLWLQLCKDHFQKLLFLPMPLLESSLDDSLEDSPLIVSSIEEVQSPCSFHLQRLAIFLFFRCSLCLICKQHREKHDASASLKSQSNCTTCLDNECDGCSCSDKGMVELYLWLQVNLPTNMFVDPKMYGNNCLKFASSFLKLYMHEDDLLFKVLLQLLALPFCTQPWFSEGPCQDVKKDMVSHISNLFNPVNMFCLFLKELDYDHGLLLDYLISKDAGTSCLEYLLRCLRIISDSRHSFLNSSTKWDAITHSSCKKRKVLLNSSSISESLSPSLPKSSSGTLFSTSDSKGGFGDGYNHCRVGIKAFRKAINCLQSLKKSVENLHSKSLFPYNPEVLLKRLTLFLELQDSESSSHT